MRWVSATAVLLLAAPLAACAQEPLAGWQPPEAQAIPGVRLVLDDAVSPEDGAGSDGDVPEPAPEPAPAPAVLETDSLTEQQLGLVGGRLRNDMLPFAARFVYVPGVDAFNTHVNSVLWSAIGATGVAYAPQAHATDAGLADRGCVPGSTVWPAADVLGRAETGPAGGSGTAVTCEITAAAGTILAVTLRVVTGTPDSVTGDRIERLIVDTGARTVTPLGDRWSPEAPAALWTRAVDLLRQGADAMSSAPPAGPDEAQLELAKRALDAAVPAGSGIAANGDPAGALISFPAGLTSPELQLLGIVPTEAPLTLIADGATVREWSSAQYLAILESLYSAEGSAAPFTGTGAPATSVPVDCALIPCVALTYDDGPSQFTPQLLDTLASLQASATFYMVGGYAQGNPGPVVRAAAEGHELGSHTMNHPDLTTISLAAARAQVVGAAEVLRGLTGQPVSTFRPPYGAINQAVIGEVGMPAVLWSVDTNDWRGPGQEALFERAVGGASPGGIVLFHDTHADSVEAAAAIIVGLRNRGFEPVTVTELFGGSVPPGRVSSR